MPEGRGRAQRRLEGEARSRAASGFPVQRAATVLRHAAALVESSGHLGSEITRLVQEVHAASNPTALLGADLLERGIYAGIRMGFGGVRRAAAIGGRLGGRDARADAFLDVQSALNGAFGHLYEEMGSAFALPMTWIAPERSGGARRLAVFVHGLCMSERCWGHPGHVRFCEWAGRRLDAAVAYVRYNSGLRISANGARLAALLEREAGEREILLVGHSMGGLVARSALHQATEAGYGWVRRVSRLACLGSPHEGASLERLGNHANRLLGALPWTRPFMRLGNLRSDGIRDLRFGHLVESDWRGRAPDEPRRAHTGVGLAGDVDHLHVAAVRSEKGGSGGLGDGLVPVESALALNLHPEAAVRRELLRGMGHLALLADERVYDALRRWIEGAPAPAPGALR
jgi:pimeloyl-ACP methyl ester carboxylesterase